MTDRSAAGAPTTEPASEGYDRCAETTTIDASPPFTVRCKLEANHEGEHVVWIQDEDWDYRVSWQKVARAEAGT